jgi:aldehyde dehydrogenase (NAD+)/phenylacetaldehyde dehydrogenase
VLNVVPGFGPTAGAALVAHLGVAAVAFTGETSTGRTIMANAAATAKKLSLELGGKSPNIVLEDADLDLAARGALNAIFYNKGEVCTAGSRLLIEKAIREPLVEKILERAAKMVPGDTLDPKTRLGALTSKEQMEKVERYVAIGK